MPSDTDEQHSDDVERYEVRLTEPAEQEIDEAYLFHLSRGVDAADKWYRGLLIQIDRLALFPLAYPIAPDAEAIGGDVRQMLYGRGLSAYRVLYRVIPQFGIEPGIVRVVHVRHAAREWFTER